MDENKNLSENILDINKNDYIEYNNGIQEKTIKE